MYDVLLSNTLELRSEVSCFTPPQQGELYLSCKTYGVISIVRSRVGTRRTDAVSTACVVMAIFSCYVTVARFIILLKQKLQ